MAHAIKNTEVNNNVNITIITNITLEPYFHPLMVQIFSQNNVSPNIKVIAYDEYKCDESFETITESDLIIPFLNLESLLMNKQIAVSSGDIDIQNIVNEVLFMCRDLIHEIKKISSAKVVFLGFEDYYNYEKIYLGNVLTSNSIADHINIELRKIISSQVTYVDLKRLIANVGIRKAYDNRSKYRWNAPYSKELIHEISNEIYKQYLIEKGITKKCIVLDCDDVLWGGVISEDGIENIKLSSIGQGRAYQDFQRFLLSLHNHGVILAVCSKNDLEDIITVFQQHSDMILKEEHISCFQANWSNKAENIIKISEALNIGLDSIIFIDDSPTETSLVQSMLPDVKTILYTRDSVYEQLSCLNIKSEVNIESIKNRTDVYKTNQIRMKLKEQFEDYQEYLKALKTEIIIKISTPLEYGRISELSQRTNKCTNGVRYTIDEIRDVKKSDHYKLYSIYVSDKYSDLGLVGAIGMNNDTVDLFCLSCRSLGRNIEIDMIHYIKTNHLIKSFNYIPSGKNENIEALLKTNLD